MCTYFKMLSFVKSIKLSFYVYGADYIEYDNDFYYNDSNGKYRIIRERKNFKILIGISIAIFSLCLFLFCISTIMIQSKANFDSLFIKILIFIIFLDVVFKLLSMIEIVFLGWFPWIFYICCIFGICFLKYNIFFALTVYSNLCLCIFSLFYILFFSFIFNGLISISQKLRNIINFVCIILFVIWGCIALLYVIVCLVRYLKGQDILWCEN